MLQWPKYGHLRDTAEVLLAESEETYAFIEKVSYLSSRYPGSSPSRAKCASNLRVCERVKVADAPISRSQMIRSISGPLRSKRIHIGMDEAHGVSEGRYRQIFGYKDGTQVVSPAFPWLGESSVMQSCLGETCEV